MEAGNGELRRSREKAQRSHEVGQQKTKHCFQSTQITTLLIPLMIILCSDRQELVQKAGRDKE